MKKEIKTLICISVGLFSLIITSRPNFAQVLIDVKGETTSVQQYLYLVIIALLLLNIVVISLLYKIKSKSTLEANDEEKRLEYRELEVLFESMKIGVIISDKYGSIIRKNSVAESLLDINDCEKVNSILEVNKHMISGGGDELKFEEFPTLAITEHSNDFYQSEVGIINSDKEVTWLFVSAKKIVNGTTYKVVTVVEDITRKKATQTELITAKVVAEEATKAKSDFLTNMSHEIRTPMNAIVGLGTLLEKTGLNPKQHDYVSKINKSSKNLVVIVNDILDFSKLESGGLNLEVGNFSLDEILTNISSVIGLKSHEKDLELIYIIDENVPDQLNGDALRLNQILFNLCDNAVKFTNSGDIIIRISLVEESKDEVVIKFSVKDSGIGMTEKQVKSLFDDFKQGDASTTRRYGGTGLGLAISKNLIEMMGGFISVESIEKVGSEFFFDIPLKRISESEIKKIVIPSYVKNKKVAVIDDNLEVLEVFKKYLSILDEKPTLFSDVSLFLKSLETKEYDIVIIDSQIKDVSGFDVLLEVMLELEKLPKTVLATTHWNKTIIEKAESLGFDSILVKPITQSSIVDAIISDAIITDNNYEVDDDNLEDEMKSYNGNRILLVEDNLINQQVVCENLEGLGFVVEIANNGLEAIEMISHTTELYDLVLMDLQMPVLDGFSASKLIRKDMNSLKLPIIALSADSMKETLSRLEEIDVQDHVLKPIDLGKLFKAMKGVLKEKSGGLIKEKKEVQEIDFNKLTGVLDHVNALKRLGNNKELYLKLVTNFSKMYSPGLIKSVTDFDVSSDIVRYFHTLKGLAGNIGSKVILELAKELELGIKSNLISIDELDANALVIDLDKKLHTLNLELDIFVSTIVIEDEQTDEEILSDEVFKEKLKELFILVEDYDLDSESILLELKSTIVDMKDQLYFNSIKEALENYDYDEALERLNELVKED